MANFLFTDEELKNGSNQEFSRFIIDTWFKPVVEKQKEEKKGDSANEMES